MKAKLSRRKIAQYVADQTEAGKPIGDLINEVAAYMIETKTVRQAGLMARDIEDALATRGTVVATVTTARPLADELRQHIVAMIGAKQVHMRELVDPSLIGGVMLETPNHRLDATVRQKLNVLLQAKL